MGTEREKPKLDESAQEWPPRVKMFRTMSGMRISADPTGDDFEYLSKAESDALIAKAKAEVWDVAIRLASILHSEECVPLDHACGDCVPKGEAVIPGFVCAYHQTKFKAEERAKALARPARVDE